MFQNKSFNYDLHKHPSKKDVEKFWNNWWDRTIKSFDGKDGWTNLLEFLQKVIETANNKKSTIAFSF